MTTQKQIEANGQNALLSRGAVTEEGKAIVSKNAIKHGIFTQDLIISHGEGKENREEYQELLNNLIQSLNPNDQMEHLLVEKIAVDYWRLRRVLRFENGTISKYPGISVSEFYKKLNLAVNKALEEVNKKTHFQMKLDYNSKKVCMFKKRFKTSKKLRELISNLPNAYKEEYPIIKLLIKWLQKKGVDYVLGNIKYTNENYKSNYKKFLEKALKGNWGIKIVYECETARKEHEARQKKIYGDSWGIYKTLSKEKQAAVDNHIENDYLKEHYPNKDTRLWYYFQGALDSILRIEIPDYERVEPKNIFLESSYED